MKLMRDEHVLSNKVFDQQLETDMAQSTEYQRIEASEHHFVRLLSGQWLFRAPVGEIVLLIENEADKEEMLAKWTDYYVQHRPSHFAYTLMVSFPPFALLYAAWTGIRAARQPSSFSRFHSEFADELERFPRSSLAQFRFAQSGEILGALKLKYALSRLFALVSIYLLLGGATSALPVQLLEFIGDHPLTFYLSTSIVALFAESSAWALRSTLQELAEI